MFNSTTKHEGFYLGKVQKYTFFGKPLFPPILYNKIVTPGANIQSA